MGKDIVEESWVYQEILQRGVEKGTQQERQEALRRERQSILRFLQVRFPDLIDLAQKQLNSVTDPDALQSLTLRVFLAQNAQEISYALGEVGKQEKSTVSRCSFCAKSQDQVNRLTAGPGNVYICDECVDIYRKHIEEAAGEPITIRKLVRVCSSCETRCPASYRYCFNCGSQFTQET